MTQFVVNFITGFKFLSLLKTVGTKNHQILKRIYEG